MYSEMWSFGQEPDLKTAQQEPTSQFPGDDRVVKKSKDAEVVS